MGAIATTIKLNDGMTSVLNAMYKGVNHLVGGLNDVQSASGKAFNAASFKNAQQEFAKSIVLINKIEQEYNETGNEIRQSTNAQHSFNSAINKGATGAGNLLNSVKGFVSAYVGIQGTKGGINATDTYIGNAARLGLITDNLKEQRDLQNQIYASAQRSRGAYNDTVSVVAKLGLLAPDAFSSNKEIVGFTELINKSFKLSGASKQESTAAMYQLTQAMASGRLQGDEFRSIIENAPMLANAIAEYTGVGREGLKELSSDGAISAQIIKASLFSIADDIEEKYKTLPKTFGDVWTSISNTAVMQFSSVMQRANDLLNTDGVQSFITGLSGGLEWASMQAQNFMSWIERTSIIAGPNLRAVSGDFAEVGGYIFGANGLAGNFLNTLTRIGASNGFRRSALMVASATRSVAQGVNLVITTLGALNQRFGGLLPAIVIVTGSIITFRTIMSFTTGVVEGITIGINTLNGAYQVIKGTADAATIAQEGLNRAMIAHPYLAIASAAITAAGAIYTLIKAQKDQAKASGLASGASNDVTLEEIKFAKAAGIDVNTAKMIQNSDASYQQEIDKYQELYDEKSNFIANYGSKDYVEMSEEAKADLADARAVVSDIQNKINYLKDERDNARGAIRNQYLESQANRNALMNMDTSLDINDFKVDEVGKVGEVDKINGTVDITSEDLKYLRDIAEQEAIYRVTQTTVKPDIVINYGGVRETADVDAILNKLETQLIEVVNNSANGVHY